MKLIAIGTLHGHRLVKQRDPLDPTSKKDQYDDILVMPGQEFDTKDFGIDDKEADRLIERKAARHVTNQMPDQDA